MGPPSHDIQRCHPVDFPIDDELLVTSGRVFLANINDGDVHLSLSVGEASFAAGLGIVTLHLKGWLCTELGERGEGSSFLFS